MAPVGKLVQKQETAIYKRRNKTIRKHTIHKIENKNTKKENKRKMNIKKLKSSNKIAKRSK